ncbi:MAG: hypothetical protein WCA35_30080 [Kovacikia sp.]
MKILVLNAGFSTQKSCLYELTGDTLPDLRRRLLGKPGLIGAIARARQR